MMHLSFFTSSSCYLEKFSKTKEIDVLLFMLFLICFPGLLFPTWCVLIINYSEF
jgi:hypothetical protein